MLSEIERKIFQTSTSFLTSWFGNCTNWIYILVIRGRIILLRQLIWFKYCVQKFSMRGMKTCYNLRSFSLFILFFFTFWRNWHDYCQDPRFNAKIFQISHILLTEPIRNAFYDAYNDIPNTQNVKHHSNRKYGTMKNHSLPNLPTMHQHNFPFYGKL